MKYPEETMFTGIFSVAPGQSVYGTLSLNGSQTKLRVHDNTEAITSMASDVIDGELSNLDRVTLFDCVLVGARGAFGRDLGEKVFFADVFPHFVIFGERRIAATSPAVASVSFVIDDSKYIFYDHGAFGSISNSGLVLKSLADQYPDEFKYLNEIGEHSCLMYFSGKFNIVSIQTNLGKISADHSPSITLGGLDGIGIKNRVRIKISFDDPITFQESMRRVNILVNSLGMLAGRPQNITDIMLSCYCQSSDNNIQYRVYWSSPPRRDKENEREPAHPSDIPVNGGLEPRDFERVFKEYIDRHEIMSEARNRLYACIAKQSHYDQDRLIGAANMFDLLPDFMYPKKPPLSGDLSKKVDEIKKSLKSFPRSLERNSVLGYLHRLDQHVLKSKVRCRASIILFCSQGRFKDIVRATDIAINARNHFVHGSELRYAVHDYLPFLTDTLEFVFLASELIECGWNIEGYFSRSSVSHPLGDYDFQYREWMPKLLELIEPPELSFP